MSEQTAEQIVASVLLRNMPGEFRMPIDYEMSKEDARAVVAALREAGYLVDQVGEVEYARRVGPIYMTPVSPITDATHTRVVGPWVAVDSGEQE